MLIQDQCDFRDFLLARPEVGGIPSARRHWRSPLQRALELFSSLSRNCCAEHSELRPSMHDVCSWCDDIRWWQAKWFQSIDHLCISLTHGRCMW